MDSNHDGAKIKTIKNRMKYYKNQIGKNSMHRHTHTHTHTKRRKDKKNHNFMI